MPTSITADADNSAVEDKEDEVVDLKSAVDGGDDEDGDDGDGDDGDDEDIAVAVAVDEAAVRGAVAAAAAAAVAEAFADGDNDDDDDDPALAETEIPATEGEEEGDGDPAAVADATAVSKFSADGKPKKKRLCRFPGCNNTVKAQGHCQRHGAKTKRCRTPGCNSQAQGSHEGYCKRHWREFAAPADQRRARKRQEADDAAVKPVGWSVYDSIVPASFSWRLEGGSVVGGTSKSPKKLGGEIGNDGEVKREVSKASKAQEQAAFIPILQHIIDNEHQEAGWHRVNERLARGIRPPKSLSTQLESWEKQLAVMEMALIAGTDTKQFTVHKISKLLAHAWGREKGFHKLMIDKHCARRGDVERKKRVDAGLPLSAEKKAIYKAKFEASREAKRRRLEATQQQEDQETLAKKVATEVYATLPVAAPNLVEPAANPVAAMSDGAELQQDAGVAEQLVEALAQVPHPLPVEEAPKAEDPTEEAPPPMEEPSIEEMVTVDV